MTTNVQLLQDLVQQLIADREVLVESIKTTNDLLIRALAASERGDMVVPRKISGRRATINSLDVQLL